MLNKYKELNNMEKENLCVGTQTGGLSRAIIDINKGEQVGSG